MRVPGHHSPTMTASVMASSPIHQDFSQVPRRAQWVPTDNTCVSANSRLSSPGPRIQTLDETGFDQNAFETLKYALERHHSLRGLSEKDVHGPYEEDGTPSTSSLRSAIPSAPTSVPDPQPNENLVPLPTWHYTSNYTGTNDPYLTAPSESTYPLRRTLDSSLSINIGTPFSSSLLAQRTHDVPGKTWIGPLGLEGLPVKPTFPDFDNIGAGNGLDTRQNPRRDSGDTGMGKRHIARLAAEQPTRAVRGHTRCRWHRLHHKANDKRYEGPHKPSEDYGDKTGQGKHSTHSRRQHHHAATSDTDNNTDFTDLEIDGARSRQDETCIRIPVVLGSQTPLNTDRDLERHVQWTANEPSLGTGILSALLALYGPDHNHGEGGTSVSSTRTSGPWDRGGSGTGSEHGYDKRHGDEQPRATETFGRPLESGAEMDGEGEGKSEREGNEGHKERGWERDKEERRKGKKAKVYITRHIASILQRQEFIMKLARAMMMFGGPSHRLAAQIQSTARVLDLELSCMYLPDLMLISFEDSVTGTSNVKFIRQGSALDLEKLGDAHELYWRVIHDAMSVSVASTSLDVLMRKKPLYNFAQLILIGGMCSASICSVSFAGSFIDSLVAAPLGALLVAIQLLSGRHSLYGNVFEITIATLLSFISAALASTKHVCYAAVASSSVVLILPGFIVLSGSLELLTRSLVAGAVRLCFALIYSLFLGFGLAIGAELYQKVTGNAVFGTTYYTCVGSHDSTGPWWQQTPSLWWTFLTVPMYSLFLSMRLMAPWRKKELILLVTISCIGWSTNHFVSTKFSGQSYIGAAVGAFAVGFVSNIYDRFFNGNAFIVMITGILFQVPSGFASGGLLNFVFDQTSGSSSSFLSGFQTGVQLISVAIGLTVGLGISLVVVHPIQSRRRAGGLFSL